MKTKIHEVLGLDRMKAICDEHGLTDGDAKIIDEILEEWEKLIGKPQEKMEVVLKKISGNPRVNQITVAMFKINTEFASKANSIRRILDGL
jgi:hypothetical protein